MTFQSQCQCCKHDLSESVAVLCKHELSESVAVQCKHDLSESVAVLCKHDLSESVTVLRKHDLSESVTVLCKPELSESVAVLCKHEFPESVAVLCKHELSGFYRQYQRNWSFYWYANLLMRNNFKVFIALQGLFHNVWGRIKLKSTVIIAMSNYSPVKLFRRRMQNNATLCDKIIQHYATV